jgi:predicted amidophosphoribosyltransferase
MKNRLEKFPLEEPLSLVPVPQSASRRWELAGGSAVRVCQMIRDLRKNPDDRVLDLLEVGPKSTAQAMSQGDERYSRKATIHARADIARTDIEVDFEAVPTIILVDDFLTSGSTLRAAAKATREGLGRLGLDLRLHVFVLGFRPALFDRE